MKKFVQGQQMRYTSVKARFRISCLHIRASALLMEPEFYSKEKEEEEKNVNRDWSFTSPTSGKTPLSLPVTHRDLIG